MAAELAGKHVLITSGPTRADIDAVRYISNRSSGRLGKAIALEALARGARVTMVAGPDSAVPGADEARTASAASGQAGASARLRILPIVTVEDLIRTLEAELKAPQPPDAVIHAMAVLDYVPAATLAEKVPSEGEAWDIRLVRTPKVIRLIRDWAPKTCLVQFKLEVGMTDEQLRAAALASMRGNRADLAVANDLSHIRDEVHPALIIAADGRVLARPGTKRDIASALCDILGTWHRSSRAAGPLTGA
jgi:phosphopantothenoylcysteine synthetase/decarboxylase